MNLRFPIKTVWCLFAAILLVGCVPNTIPNLSSTNSLGQFLQVDTPTNEAYIPPADTATESPYIGPVETATTGPYPGNQTPLPSPTVKATVVSTQGYPGPASPTSPFRTPSSQTPFAGASSTPSGLTGTPLPGLSETPAPETTTTPIQQPIATAQPPQNLFQTVTIWHSWSPAETKTLEDVIQSFQGIYPNVKFVLTYVPLDELQAKYDREAYLGDGPSLLLGPADWGPAYYDQGLVADLGSTADAQFLATINPAALNEARYKSALIGLPYAIRSGVVMYRNRTILPKAPTTFDELLAMSKAATQGGTVGAYLEWSFFYSAALLDGIGGQLMDQNGDPGFNSSLGVEWLKLLYAFKQAGATEFNGNRDLEAFKSGKAGIIIDGTWNKAQLVQAVGSQNLAIDPWPAYKFGHLAGYLQTDNIYLNANFSGDQRYAALQFMGFFLAREVQAIMTRAGHIPAVMDVKVDDPFMQQEMEAFKGAVAYPIRPEISAYWDPLQSAMLNVVNNSADPVLALQQAYQATVDGIAKIRAGH
jgi:arabinogalactan oligomer / maltooligosaccharide transport system substrate-binding protein